MKDDVKRKKLLEYYPIKMEIMTTIMRMGNCCILVSFPKFFIPFGFIVVYVIPFGSATVSDVVIPFIPIEWFHRISFINIS